MHLLRISEFEGLIIIEIESYIMASKQGQNGKPGSNQAPVAGQGNRKKILNNQQVLTESQKN